ncbi:universal stress protein [Micromonospora sp. NPDC049274]|uniref:universal stress protein n=1 Tax=Micromonospora sp. NPDC049274 TaxID=3154829 RepID=UPI00341692A6
MTGPPILVGVDGSDCSLVAVDLAVRAAALRGCPVGIVYCDPWADHPAWAHNDPAGELTGGLLSDPQQAIRAAIDRADTNEVPVTGEVLAGNPTTVLVRESADADLLVLGHRGRGGFPELLLGSVAVTVAAHAACPVLITRGSPQTGGEVLIGVDGSPGNHAAIGFAFHEAALRKADLRALHTRQESNSTDHASTIENDPGSDFVEQDQVLTEALSSWSQKYRQVVVHRQLATGRAAHAIVTASNRAQLVVLGARGRGGLHGRRLGSVSHAVLHHAACPVTIVHDASKQQGAATRHRRNRHDAPQSL